MFDSPSSDGWIVKPGIFKQHRLVFDKNVAKKSKNFQSDSSEQPDSSTDSSSSIYFLNDEFNEDESW